MLTRRKARYPYFLRTLRWVALASLPWCAPYAADDLPDAGDREQELAELRARIAEASENLAAIGSEKDGLLQQLASVEKDYGASMAAMKNLLQQAVDKRQEMAQLQGKIALQKRLIGQQSRGLQGMLRSAYALGRKDRLKLLLNQQDPELSSRMLVYYRYLNQSRLQKLAALAASLRQLQGLEEEMRGQSEHLDGLLELQELEQAKLADIQRGRKELLAQLERDYAGKRRQLEELQASERELQALLGGLQEVAADYPFTAGEARPFDELRGELVWPVRGKLLQSFGSPRDEGRWDGVLIEAKEGTEIRAVTAGRVIYADWMRGYGLLLIIGHEQGYMTLYAFNQSLYKNVGDQVAAGEVIAAVGASGGRQKTGLYFGIRKDGKAVDPVLWCRQ